MHSSDNGVSVVGPLTEEGVRDVWPKVEAYLSDALAREDWKLRPEDLLGQIADGLVGMYAIWDDETGEILGAVCCESFEYPRSNVFNVAVCGGKDLYRWAHLMGAIEEEAVRLGCDTVRISGRPGWGRVFPDYREVHRVFERKVVA